MVFSAVRISADDSANSTASSANSSPGMREYRRGWAPLPHSAEVFGGVGNFISNSNCDFRGIIHALDHIEEFAPNAH
ncbi:hypothetical protein AYI69_g9956 [Smittium culicis]|uniref:Uncharacterized protein n=1 Tax=Smittium culicis TaxID=133412 RepID=A0A1R1X928_9FUNG|nr:hypothetical protein AYI69_g9956 [Smittium culicis]